jgi:hypothetical protein
MDAVRGDHDIGGYMYSIREVHDCPIVVLLETDASMVCLDEIAGQPGHQHPEQIGAVHAIDLDSAVWISRPHRSNERPIRVSKLRVGPPGAPASDVRSEAQPSQHANAIGLEREASADFRQGRRLLVHVHLDAALKQGIRGGNAADTAADDCHPEPGCTYGKSPPSVELERSTSAHHERLPLVQW